MTPRILALMGGQAVAGPARTSTRPDPSDDREERQAVARWLRTAVTVKRACQISPVSHRSVTISLAMAEKLAGWIGEEGS